MARYSSAARRIIDRLHDRPVAFHPALVPLLGGPDEALFISQLLFWDGKGASAGRWIYKTQEEWERETGLSRYRQLRVRRRLNALGVLEERRAGVPARLYYRLDLGVLAELAGAAAPAEPAPAASHSSMGQDPDPDRDTVPAPAGDTSPELACEDATCQPAPPPQAITENTAQITMPDTACPGPHDPAEVWRSACQNLKLALLPGSFEAWIEPCVLRALEEYGGRMRARVEVSSNCERDWLTHRMGIVLPRALGEVLGCEVDVTYCLPGEGPSSAPAPVSARSPDVPPTPIAAPLPDASAPPKGPRPAKVSPSAHGRRAPNVSRPQTPSRKRAPPAKARPARRG